jgi:hypothetical protein
LSELSDFRTTRRAQISDIRWQKHRRLKEFQRLWIPASAGMTAKNVTNNLTKGTGSLWRNAFGEQKTGAIRRPRLLRAQRAWKGGGGHTPLAAIIAYPHAEH